MNTEGIAEAFDLFLKAHNINLRYYIVAADNLKRTVNFEKSYPICIIQNTDRLGNKGLHWTCYFFNQKGEYTFFDSMGKSPAFYGIETPPGKCIQTNNIKLQGDSNLCAGYVLWFLFQSCLGVGFFDVLKGFGRNVRKNDVNICMFLLELVKIFNVRRGGKTFFNHVRMALL